MLMENNNSLLRGCIYRSQSNYFDKNGCNENIKGITKLIRIACDHNSLIVIAGDFNLKEIDWERWYASLMDCHLLDFIETLQDCFETLQDCFETLQDCFRRQHNWANMSPGGRTIEFIGFEKNIYMSKVAIRLAEALGKICDQNNEIGQG